MATRKKTTEAAKESEYKNEICDNCDLATWVTHLYQHLDHEGKPICLTCRYEQKYFIVRGRRACQHFVKRKEQSNEQRTIIANVRRNPATTGFVG